MLPTDLAELLPSDQQATTASPLLQGSRELHPAGSRYTSSPVPRCLPGTSVLITCLPAQLCNPSASISAFKPSLACLSPTAIKLSGPAATYLPSPCGGVVVDLAGRALEAAMELWSCATAASFAGVWLQASLGSRSSPSSSPFC